MNNSRRKFIKNTSAASLGLSMLGVPSFSKPYEKQTIRLGIIGTGARGLSQLSVVLHRNDVLVTAICDIDLDVLKKAQDMITKAGQDTPAVYSKGEYDYQNLLKRDDVDAVLICTPWLWHTPMAVDSMKSGKAVGLEVAGATDIQECWDLVDTYEATKTSFMVMENVCYRRDVMAVLNMVRQDMFGELLHLEGGYQHDLRHVKFNNGKQLYGGGVEFGEKGYSEARWRTNHSVHRNGDLYPTHGLGPVSSYLDINRGNRFQYLTSMASKSKGLHDYIVNHPEGGENHSNAEIEFKLGDIITTSIMTVNGETIRLTHDTNLPRPYSLGFRVQGSKGLWMAVNKSIYFEGKGEPHRWESAEPYLTKYDHPLWKKYASQASGAGHGGMDFFVLHAFIEALKRNEPMPLDVYDCAAWAAVTCLSEESIAQGSGPVQFPDFTRGKWIKRKPIIALNDAY